MVIGFRASNASVILTPAAKDAQLTEFI